MFEGRYGLAMAWVDTTGKEGALSATRFIDVPAGGGISLSFPPAPAGAQFARVYRTPSNGRILYRAADVPVALTTYLLGRGRVGNRAQYQFMRAMTPGAIVRLWKGRLITVNGSVLTLSEPLAYHLTDPRHNFFAFPREVAFVEGVEGGVYVGQTDETVLFLRGTDPHTWEQATTGANPPVPRSSFRACDAYFAPQLQLEGTVAVWLAQNGYVIGRNDGRIVESQDKRITIPVVAAVGRSALFKRRVLTIVNQ
jgi:hypothetical protein